MSDSAASLEQLSERIGETLLVSDWLSISQEEVDAFGRLTRDPDPMHMDPDWARTHGPFGETVLYGFLTLSLLPALAKGLRFRHGEHEPGYDVNYGFNRIRFVSPIPVGRRFRDHVVLKAVERRPDGGLLVTTEHTIEVEGGERPALVAEWLGLLVRHPAAPPAGKGSLP